MMILDRFVNGKKLGYIKVYEDDLKQFTVQVSVEGQKSLYPKTFPLRETALAYAEWVEANWSYHIKEVSVIKTTPLTYH